jgi:hypothetical protein
VPEGASDIHAHQVRATESANAESKSRVWPDGMLATIKASGVSTGWAAHRAGAAGDGDGVLGSLRVHAVGDLVSSVGIPMADPAHERTEQAGLHREPEPGDLQQRDDGDHPDQRYQHDRDQVETVRPCHEVLGRPQPKHVIGHDVIVPAQRELDAVVVEAERVLERRRANVPAVSTNAGTRALSLPSLQL